MTEDTTASTGRSTSRRIADALPSSAKTLLVDTYLTSREQASARVFRVYRPTPPHYHATATNISMCFRPRHLLDEGSGDQERVRTGDKLLFFERGQSMPCRS